MKPEKAGVAIARSKEGNEELRVELSKRGIEAAAVDTIEFVDPDDWTEVDDALGRISTFDWVAFTSPRGVHAFGRRMEALKMKGVGLGTRFAAVGPKTASALAGLGIEAAYVPAEFLTSALGRGLPASPGSRILLLRADRGDKELVRALVGRGFEVEDVVAYRTAFVSAPIEGVDVKSTKVVAFASPSEVEGFKRRVGEAEFRDFAARATAACIGPVTARAAEAAGFGHVVSAARHTVEGLVETIGEEMAYA
jgi:uroporphyrinogen-III synthase